MSRIFVASVVLCFVVVLLAGTQPADSFAVGKILPVDMQTSSQHLSAGTKSVDDEESLSRRRLLARATATALSTLAAAATVPLGACSAEDTIWLTGKVPVVPGQKVKDKNDVSGTRKDPNFLRSLSDCKNQCENTLGSDGYAKTKEECLSECQDICCTTYQQCTFGIVQRI